MIDIDHSAHPSAVAVDGQSKSVAHDGQGRIESVGGATYVYGPRGRLVFADNGSQHEEYLYDAAGRLSHIDNGKERTIIHDGEQMIAAVEPGLDGPRWEAVWGAYLDQILEFENFDTDQRYMAITDHRNDVVGWWNAGTRQMEHLIEYTPHGRIRLIAPEGLAPDGSPRCEEEGTGDDCVRLWGLPQFGFASAYRSERTGVVNMRHRWYSPELGQFLTHDPAGYVDAYNMYAYSGFDPINHWDPFGLGSTGTANTDVTTNDPPTDPSLPGAAGPDRSGWGFVKGFVSEGGATLGKGALMANPVVLGAVAGYGLYSTVGDVLSQRSASDAFDVANERLNPFMRAGRAWQTVDRLKDGDSEELGRASFRATEETANLALTVAGAAAAAPLRPKGCSNCPCFVAGTLVLMADGRQIPIEEIVPGDWVLADDPEDDEPPGAFQVTAALRNFTEALVNIQIGDEIIEATREHPFWVVGAGWVAARELLSGDLLLTPHGETVSIRDVWLESADEPTFNLTVDGVSTFYAVVGGDPVLVHNQDIDLGEGYTGRVDPYNTRGRAAFEVHVFDPSGDEIGIHSETDWIEKHGLGEVPDLPENVENRLKGRVVQENRARGYLPEKGKGNIKGERWKVLARDAIATQEGLAKGKACP